MPLRVRHLACLAPPRMGGIGAAALRLCEGLQERGIQTELVVPRTAFAPTHPLIKPWPVRFAWGNAAVLKGLDRIFDDVDLVHLHYPFFGVAEPLLFSKPKKPVVVSYHMDADASDWRQLIFSTQRALLQGRLFRNASKLLSASFDYVESSSAATSLRTDRNKWEELPLFIDDTVYVPAMKSASEKLNVLFVGVLDRAHLFKGVKEALEAIAQVPEAHLTMIGDGDQRPALEAEVVARGLASRVTFRGKVSQEELIRAYQRADVLLFPSTSRAEAFGLVALEAQACGTPVIASRLPGVRTVVKDGETGLLVEPGSVPQLVEALRKLLTDRPLLERLGRNARTHVEAHFRRADIIDRHIQIYQGLCASPS